MRKNLFLLSLAPIVLCPLAFCAQSGSLPAATKAAQPSSSAYTWEGLTLRDTVARRPPLSETIPGTQSAFRRDLFRRGMLLRIDLVQQYTQNTLAAPVAADQQSFVGERPFEEYAVVPIFTYDLRQLHLADAQLYAEGAERWVSWNPAGPRSAGMTSLYLFKGFGEDRVGVKAGYLANHFEFIGLQVGGSVAAGAQGVYAVLPYEVGLSHDSQPAPGLNVEVRLPDHFYVKGGVQRSLDPEGGVVNVQRNRTGFRFDPHGEKLLALSEAGFEKVAKPGSHSVWFRGGYFHNSSPYPNQLTGLNMSGNYLVYALGDYQLLQTSGDHPGRGIFVGGSAMAVPASMNKYARYFEVRLYDKAPFRSRPLDLMSLLATHTGYSSYKIQALQAAGESYSRSSSSVTAAYNLHVARGTFVSMNLSYVAGPAITPRHSSALTTTVETRVFF